MASSKKDKNLTISIVPDDIVGADIYKSQDYRYASIGVKVSEDEYMRVSYEWKGDNVPDFVMSLMSWMSANQDIIDDNKEKFADEFSSFKERIKSIN